MKPDAIIKSLKAHKLALDSEEILTDGRSTITSPHQVRQCNVSDGSTKFGDTKHTFHIPRWPHGLYEVCSTSLWKQLAAWKILVNKDKFNDDESKRLRGLPTQQDRHDSDMDQRWYHPRSPRDVNYKDDMPSPHNDWRLIDQSRDSSSSKTRFKYTQFEDKRKCGEDRLPWRSPCTNRFSDAKRRVWRRSS